MVNAVGVTSVSAVPFRRFLPHEKPLAGPVRYHDYHADDETEETEAPFTDRSPPQTLSDEDMGVLLEAQREQAERASLPLAFTLAARS